MLIEDLNNIIYTGIDWSKFSDKTILITGANGFLPAYMVDTLMHLNEKGILNKPCKVIALVRNKMHALERFKLYGSNKSFCLLVQDVSEELNVDRKIHYIIHAASPASPKYYNTDPVGVILPNIQGTINTLKLAVKHQIEGYLYFSSGEVYGQLANGITMIETNYGYLDPTNVRSCYGESKRMGENICISYGHQYGVPAKIVRPFHTYGPGMKLDDGRVFSDFVSDIIHNRNLQLKSDGSALRPFCYLADAVIAFFIVLLKGVNNQAYNVSNPNQIISIKDLAYLLVNLFPEKSLQVEYSVRSDSYATSQIQGQLPDISKVSQLGWAPTTTLTEGFNKTVRSYL